MIWFSIASYGVAAAAFGIMTAVMLADYPRSRTSGWTAAATLVSMLWAAGLALMLARGTTVSTVVALDAVHAFAWTACVVSWLTSPAGKGRAMRLGLLAASAIFGLLALLMVRAGDPGFTMISPDSAEGRNEGLYLPLLGMSLVGLLAVEQVFRNAKDDSRASIRLLCLGSGGIFVVNVFVYSQATLLGGLIPLFWDGRGIANAVLAPLVLIAAKRRSQRELAISRHVAFYTASLVAVGGYLVAMAMVAYVIRGVGGSWNLLLESVFLVLALGIFVYVLFSSTIRAHAKVLLVKHFYKNKYDYRQEWLRLTEMLARSGELAALSVNGLDGIARIVGSGGGDLWLTKDGKRYEWTAAMGPQAERKPDYSSADPMVSFLASSGWVVDSEQYDAEPERYGGIFGPPPNTVLPPKTLIVPLDCRGYLQGFVVLAKPTPVRKLNFEDHDILKTAGRQVAVVLAQALAQEQLSETRQFEAVNKLSTFLMHDLKNVVAQQELVVANAKRFKHRPEFIEDAVQAIEAGATRMRAILNRLQNATAKEHTSRVELGKLLVQVCSHCADRAPKPRFGGASAPLYVDIDRDRLAMAITHAIRNAQDATASDGTIDVRLLKDASIIIEVIDDGVGMSVDFVLERLFKPFDSTKGAKGMGVGAYQIRETLRAVGGNVEVESEPGRGTSFRMILPLPVEAVNTRSVA